MTPCIPRCGSFSLSFVPFISLSFLLAALDSSLSRRSHWSRDQHFALFPRFSSFQKPLRIRSRDDARIVLRHECKTARDARPCCHRMSSPFRRTQQGFAEVPDYEEEVDLLTDCNGDRRGQSFFPRSFLLVLVAPPLPCSSPRLSAVTFVRLPGERSVSKRSLAISHIHLEHRVPRRSRNVDAT